MTIKFKPSLEEMQKEMIEKAINQHLLQKRAEKIGLLTCQDGTYSKNLLNRDTGQLALF